MCSCFLELDAEAENVENESGSDEEQSNDEDQSNDEEKSNDEEMESDGGSSDGADDEFGDDNSDDEADDENDGNAGWADALAKVLKQDKPKNKKYLVLSKVKKLSERTDKDDTDKKVTFEIDGNDDEDVKPDVDADEKPTDNELELALIARREKNSKLIQLRVKPAAMDRERERSFKRIATKGVVQLFNAVRSQQRDLVDRLEKAGPLDHKRDEVLNNINKRQFLDMLMGGKRAKSENIDKPVKEEADEEDSSRPSQWSVLRDDFMTNKKLKHWDQDEDDQEVDDNGMDS